MSHFLSKRALVTSVVIALFFSLPGLAQGQQSMANQKQQQTKKISDQELKSFANVQSRLTTIQDSAQKQMKKAIQDVGLNINSFNKIYKQMQNAESAEDVDASKKEMQKVQKASAKVEKIQRSLRQKQQMAITGEGLTLNRFNAIRQAAMQNPELLKRMQLLQQQSN